MHDVRGLDTQVSEGTRSLICALPSVSPSRSAVHYHPLRLVTLSRRHRGTGTRIHLTMDGSGAAGAWMGHAPSQRVGQLGAAPGARRRPGGTNFVTLPGVYKVVRVAQRVSATAFGKITQRGRGDVPFKRHRTTDSPLRAGWTPAAGDRGVTGFEPGADRLFFGAREGLTAVDGWMRGRTDESCPWAGRPQSRRQAGGQLITVYRAGTSSLGHRHLPGGCARWMRGYQTSGPPFHTWVSIGARGTLTRLRHQAPAGLVPVPRIPPVDARSACGQTVGTRPTDAVPVPVI